MDLSTGATACLLIKLFCFSDFLFLFVLSYLSSDHVGGLAVQKAPKGGWVLATAEIPARTLWRGNLLNLKTENCIEQDIGSGKITISTHSSSSGITTHNNLFLEMCLPRSVSKP